MLQYSKAFFGLQTDFAATAATLTGATLAQALLDHTNLYVRFGLGRGFDGAHPAWRRYVDGLSQAPDRADWTYRFYLAQVDRAPPPAPHERFGCFSYEVQDAGCVRIHFANADPLAVSPLGIERLPARLRELRALFAHVRRHHRAAVRVVGTSWLHNLRAYQRCFPPGYAASATVAAAKFRHLPLWGQFLDRHGAVRADRAEDFMRRLSRATAPQHLAPCFPLQALAVDAPVVAFYRFYGLDDLHGAT